MTNITIKSNEQIVLEKMRAEYDDCANYWLNQSVDFTAGVTDERRQRARNAFESYCNRVVTIDDAIKQLGLK